MADADIVVVGLGVMGAAALHRAARRGARAIGIERLQPGHDRGSSHGRTRIIRLGYFEHPSYVPLLREAYPMWRDIEAQSGRALMTTTGILEIGAPDSATVAGTLLSARTHGLPHEILDAETLMRRFPAWRVPADFIAVHQRDGGILAAEASVATMLHLAIRDGAQMRTDTSVTAIEPRGDGVRVVTVAETIDAKTAIVAAGPWLKKLLPDLPAPLRTTRQVLGWFKSAEPARFEREKFPVFLIESRHGVHYGFPLDADGAVKVAKHHHHNEAIDPDNYDRGVSGADESAIRDAVSEFLPGADGPLVAAQTCLYTVTPDHDFILDRLPDHPQIIVASPCSGHGFKFAPVVGDILADLALEGGTRRDISRFRLGRWA